MRNHIDHICKLACYVAPSEKHGVGIFAARDISEGEHIWYKWEGNNGIYTITEAEWELIPEFTRHLLVRYYYPLADGTRYIPLVYGTDPFCSALFCNSDSSPNINVPFNIALRDIKAHEELFSWYNVEESIGTSYYK